MAGANGHTTTPGQVTFLEAIKQAMYEEMERDPAVVLIGEDIGVYGGAFKTSEGLLERFGWERVIDTPISESAIIGAACGMSYLGLRPICEMQFMDFISCAFNQITNMLAKAHFRWGAPVPVVVRGPSGGGVHGGPFHSQNPETYFTHTPGLKVICPASAYDAKGLIKSAIRDNNPVLFFEHKFLYRRIKEELPAEDYTVPIGKARVVREGRDVSVITYAAMVYIALEAADILAKEGIELEVVDLRTVLPLDRDAIRQTVEKTNRAIVLHEDTKTGGIAGEVAAILRPPAPAPRQAPPPATAGGQHQVTFESAVPRERMYFGNYEVQPMTVMRQRIAEHMVASKHVSAHVYSVDEIDMSKVAALRAKSRDEFEKRYETKLTFMPFFVKAAVAGLRAFPTVNASLDGTNVILHKEINIGIAVALDWGLIVPVIKNADEKNILGIQRNMNDLAERARTKKLKPEEVQESTFSITNPGVFGGLFGLPVISQPNVGILGLGAIEKRPVVINDSIAIRSMCYVTLSYDHRVVDGAIAHQFLHKVKDTLENWSEPLL
jgi:2-oxoisovalerate dehydrogenase E1 component beta subunit